MSKKLKFFNKKGNPINLRLDSDGVWRGSVFLNKVSEGLFENEQIFVLEEVIDSSTMNSELSYPHTTNNTLGDGSFGPYWRTRWESDYYGEVEVDELLFTYVISEDSSIDAPVISNYKNMTIGVILDPGSYVDPVTGKLVTSVVTSEAMKIGVAINAFSGGEGVYQRKLIVEDISTSSPTKIFEVDFYGQIIGEDERLKVLLDNFGKSINLEDSLIFRDHNPAEPLPNYIELNQKRKELLLVRDDIFNYLGAYRGLINAIKFFGYQDLTIKEYWLNLNFRSTNDMNQTIISNKTVYDQLITSGFINDAIASQGNGKYKQVVTYGLFDGEYRLDLSNPGVELPSNTWKKTSLFSLVYNLNKIVPGEFDEYGYPVVEDNFLFDPEEVLIKLYGLKRKLQQGFLPTNSKIVDISGEGVYFMVYNVRNWNDEMEMNTINSGLDVSFSVYPKTGYVEDLRYFGAKTSLLGVDFPWFAGTGATGISLFGNEVSSFYNGEKYPPVYVAGMVNSIYEFYSQKEQGNIYFEGSSDQLIEDYGLTGPNPFRTASGMPIVLTFNTPDYTWSDMTMTWDQLGLPFYSEVQNINGVDVEVYVPDPNQKLYTWDSLKFSNFYEIEWIVQKSKADEGLPYYFSIRGSIYDYYNLPHFLPYTGKYDVTCKVYDSLGHVSSQTVFNFIEVKPYDLEIKVWTRYREASEYTWENTVKPWKDYRSTWSYIAEGESETQTGFPYMIFDFAKYLRDNNKASLVKIQKTVPATSSKANARFSVSSFTIESIISYFSEVLSILEPPVLTPLVVKTTTPHGLSAGDVIYIEDSYYEVGPNNEIASTNGYWEVSEIVSEYEFRIPLTIDFLSFGGWSSVLDQYSNTVGYQVDPDLYPSQKMIVNGSIVIQITDTTGSNVYKYINIQTGSELGENASKIMDSFNNLRIFPMIFVKYQLHPTYCDLEFYFDSQYGSKYNGSILNLTPSGSFNLISSDQYFADGTDEINEETSLDSILGSERIPEYISKFGFNVTLSSIARNQWSEFYSQTWDSYDFHGDFLGGFEIHNIQQGDYIKVYGVTGSTVQISSSTLGGIAEELDSSVEIGISNFDYKVLPEGASGYSPGAGITAMNFFVLTGATSSGYAPPSVPDAPILPIADFYASNTGPIQGEYVQLFDVSTGGNPAIAWSWTVEGAYFATGASFTNNGPTSQNPWVYWNTYRTEGFTVSLISYNIDGPSRPVTKEGYIHVSSGIPTPTFDWVSPSYYQYPWTQYIVGGGTGSTGDIISFNYTQTPQASNYYEWTIYSPGYSGTISGFSEETVNVQFQWNDDAEKVVTFSPAEDAYDYVQYTYPYGSYSSQSYLNLRVSNTYGTGITYASIPVVRCSNYPDYTILVGVTADSQDSTTGVLTVGATAINRTHYGTTGGWLGNLVYNQSISRSGYIGRIIQAENVESGDTQIYIEALGALGVTSCFQPGDPIQIGYVRNSTPPPITNFTVSPSELSSPGGTASFIDSSIVGPSGISGRIWEIQGIGGTSTTGPTPSYPTLDYYYDLSSETYAVGKFGAAFTVIDGYGVTGIRIYKYPAVTVNPDPYQYFDSIVTATGSYESYRIYIGQIFSSWVGGDDDSLPAKEVNDLPGSTVYSSSIFSGDTFTNRGNLGSTSSNPRFLYGPSYFANGSATGTFSNTLTGLYVTTLPNYGNSSVSKTFTNQVEIQSPPQETISSIIWIPEVAIQGGSGYLNVIDNSLYYPYERTWTSSEDPSFSPSIQSVIGYNPFDSSNVTLSTLNPGQTEVWIKLETKNDYQGMVSPLQQGIDQVINLPIVSDSSGLYGFIYSDTINSYYDGATSEPVTFYSNFIDWEGVSFTYNWDLGDGSIPPNVDGPGPHTVYWASSGSKNVSLTVTNQYGISYTSTLIINVHTNPPTDTIFGSKISIDGNDYPATGEEFNGSSTNPLPWATGITVSVEWNTGGTYGIPDNFFWTLPASVDFYDPLHNFDPNTSSARLILKDPGASGTVSIQASNQSGAFDFYFDIKDSSGITGFGSGVTMMYVRSRDIGYETNSPTGYVYDIRAKKYDPITACLTNSSTSLAYTSINDGNTFVYGSLPSALDYQRVVGNTTFKKVNYIASHSMEAYPLSTGSVFSITYDDSGYTLQSKDGGDFLSISSSSSQMFAVTDSVVRETVDGDNWNTISTIPSAQYTSVLADDDIIYVGASGGLYYSYDQGNNWELGVTGLTDTKVITVNKVGTDIYLGTNSWIYSGVGSGSGNVFKLDKSTMSWDKLVGLTADILRIFEYNGYPAVLSKDSAGPQPTMSIDYYDGTWNSLGFSQPYFASGKMSVVGGYPDAISVNGVIYASSDSLFYTPLGCSVSKNSIASPSTWTQVVDTSGLVNNAITNISYLEYNYLLGERYPIVINGNTYGTMVLDCSLVGDNVPMMITRNNLGGPLAEQYQKMSKYVYSTDLDYKFSQSNPYMLLDVYPGLSGDILGYQINYQSTETKGAGNYIDVNFESYSFDLGFDSASGTIACSNYSSPSTYWSDSNVFADSTVLYTDEYLTTLAATGYYSDGIKYGINLSSVTVIASC
jgi:hypothetical protein